MLWCLVIAGGLLLETWCIVVLGRSVTGPYEATLPEEAGALVDRHPLRR